MPESAKPGLNWPRIFTWAIAISLVLMAVILFFSGQGGIVEVRDDQAAVIFNYVTGEVQTVLQPGYCTFLPFVQHAFVFDKSIQKFLMQGDKDVDRNHVAKLTVRAIDGSNFWFETIEIQYAIIPSKAAFVLTDSGEGEAFKLNWMRANARSILRDEFGKFSSSEVADPTVYTLATTSAEERLNALLQPHGIEVVNIITPKPKFDDRYEQAIEDRKVADQEVERIKQRAVQLQRERERRVAEIDSSKAVEFEEQKGTLEAARIAAEQDLVRVERNADAYKTRVVAQGEAMKSQLLEKARGQTEKARLEAEGLQAKIEALETRGEILVRERLAERLAEMTFSLVPYTADSQPTRLEVTQTGAAALGGQP